MNLQRKRFEIMSDNNHYVNLKNEMRDFTNKKKELNDKIAEYGQMMN
jgi:hypothetical protein